MRKLAIFVEGQTEQIFVQRFLTEIGGERNVTFEVRVLSGGSFTTLRGTVAPALGPKLLPSYFVLIVNCQNDERVKSVVLDQRASLTKNGYSLILGLRDLYPRPLADLKKTKIDLKYGIPTNGVPTFILLAVAEIEAWFLQEFTHFQRIDVKLNPACFKNDFGFDPMDDCAEMIAAPAALLNEIYSSVGKAYKKKRSNVERTVRELDYERLYLDISKKLPHLGEFLEHIDGFFSHV